MSALSLGRWSAVVASLSLALTSLVAAQDESAPRELNVDIRVEEGIVAAQLVEALEADLGASVTRSAQSAAPVLIVEAEPGQSIVIRFRTGEGERLRRVEAEGTPEERTLTVALLASNLVRNEADQLLLMLRPPREVEVEEAPEAEETPETDVVPQSEPLDVVVVGEAESPEEAPLSPEPGIRSAFGGIDFVPFVGTSSFRRGRDRRHLSVGVLSSLSGGISGVGASSVADLVLGDVTGVQMGGVAAMALGDVVGAQGSGVLSYAHGHVRGLQLSGVVNVARDVRGIQASTMNISRGRVEGLQVGTGNYALNVDGAQLGLVNYAHGRVRGVQLGLVNIAQRSSTSIGLVNIHRDGRTQLRIGGDSTGFVGASVVHGSGIVHNIYSLAINPFDGLHAAVGWGIGLRARLGERLHLDVDALGHVLIDTVQGDEPHWLVEPRLLLGVRLFGVFGIYASASYQLHISNRPLELLGPFGQVHQEAARDQAQIAGWPAISVGVQIF